jgi:hypothetical protein
MAYATPLCSALLLASLGAAALTWNLLTGAVVIVLAGLLSRAEPQDDAFFSTASTTQSEKPMCRSHPK